MKVYSPLTRPHCSMLYGNISCNNRISFPVIKIDTMCYQNSNINKLLLEECSFAINVIV